MTSSRWSCYKPGSTRATGQSRPSACWPSSTPRAGRTDTGFIHRFLRWEDPLSDVEYVDAVSAEQGPALLIPSSLDYLCFLLQRATPRGHPAACCNRKEIRG